MKMAHCTNEKVPGSTEIINTLKPLDNNDNKSSNGISNSIILIQHFDVENVSAFLPLPVQYSPRGTL